MVVVFLKSFVVITCRDIQHSPDAVVPGLCWADRAGWDVVDAGGMHILKMGLHKIYKQYFYSKNI